MDDSQNAVQHTPGPWHSGTDRNGAPFVIAGGVEKIANCWHPVSGDGYANARLIAAAPDLLEAARAAYKVIDILWVSHHANRSDDALEKLRAAIDRASGK